jgi:hypothetical protein
MECYLDIATNSKHPYWVFLGTTPDVADLAQIEQLEIFVANQVEPQVSHWLSKIGEHKLKLHIKLVTEAGTFRTEYFQAESQLQADGTTLVFLQR